MTASRRSGSARFGFVPGGGSRARSLLGGALLVLLALPGCPADPVPGGPRAYGVQLHTHGSLSEGPASMHAHAVAAGELGGAVDAIWWTDHDWRIAGHTYVTGFDFESGLSEFEPVPAPLRMTQIDGREPMPDWASGQASGPGDAAAGIETLRKGFSVRHMPSSETRVQMRVDDREARDGARSLLLSLDAPAKGRDALVLGFESARRRHIASLASGVTLRLSILPVAITGDVRMGVSVALSQTRPGERNAIDFVLQPADSAAAPGEPTIEWRTTAGEADRVRVATIPVPTEPGVWNDWRFDLTDLATRHGLGGIDNSLVDLSLAVEVADGGRFEAYVDALGIDRAVLGEPLLEIERGMARELTTPALTHHVGQEISYAAHLNAYGMDVPLADSTRFPHGLTPDEAVDWAHAHSGLVSLNHFFGTEYTMISHRFPRSREALDASIARLIEQRAFGVDLLEVGYRSRGHGLAAFLELWDGLSRAGIPVVGIGVSDSHDADTGWKQGPNNFITWIYADSVAEADLLVGLRGGRAFFGDPTLFDGLLDLSSESGARMGDVRTVEPGPQVIEIVADGLRAGQSVRVIRDGEVMAEHATGAAEFRARHRIEVDASTFVRTEVMADGEPIALSNPIHFVVRGAQ